MNRTTIILLAAVAALTLGATDARAQCADGGTSSTCDWTATVTVEATLACAPDFGLAFDFGTVFKSDGVLLSDETNHVGVTCAVDPPQDVVVSFTLPSVLTHTDAVSTVPIIYGIESARCYDGDQRQTLDVAFDPALGATCHPTTGILDLTLGENGPNIEASEVAVDVTNAPAAGTYNGAGTVTIALP